MAASAPRILTYADYLEAEHRSESKHEWHAGVIVAMSGGTIEHARLGSAMQLLLGKALAGRPCVVLSPDARVRIVAADRSHYADALVVCTRIEHAPDDADAVTNPVVIAEVLSPRTEGYDRGEKARNYRLLPSLREYVLVSSGEPLVEVWEPDGRTWRTREYIAGEVVELRSLGIALSVDELYRDPLAAPQ
ncbi:MAG: Uma2 family endonuclease [Polyangiaceae bacterium]